MSLNKRIKAIAPSMTLGISAKAKKMISDGIAVLNFSAGEPDFDTPDFIKQACKKALDEGKTKYVPSGGIPELKKGIIEKLKNDNGLTYAAEEIQVSVGAKGALYNIVMTIVDEGDEVLLPAPYWVSYYEMIQIAGGKPVIIPTTIENNFKITANDLKKYTTSKTKAIILCSPSNPTGSVYTKDELKALADFIETQNMWVISDEIYEKILYDGEKHVSIASFSEAMKKKTIVINGFSKAFSMTGWRLGYAAGDKEVISFATRLQEHSTSGTVSFVQYAAAEGLKNTAFIEEMRKEFQKRRDEIVKGLNTIKGIKCPMPKGAFYVFPDISALIGKTIRGKKIENSMILSDLLLEQAHVATVPGIAFGMDSNIRLSFATSLEDIKEGVRKMKEFIEG